ncbi:MAG: P-loop NTPase fold protein [Acholeplasma sp.]|nr:P-loop NTPase fold protein [Acholeplasma sp.]
MEKAYDNIKVDKVDLRKKDYLGTKLYSEELKEKINRYFSSKEKKPFYIGVIGNWGSGKSTIVETALNEIQEKDKKIKLLTYDAWKYEGDSFRRNFIESILKQSGIKKESKLFKNIDEQLYEDKTISSQSIIERIKLLKIKGKEYKTLPAYIGAVLVLIAVGFIFWLTRDSLKTTFALVISIISYLGAINMLYATTTYTMSKYFSPEQFCNAFRKILLNIKGNKNIIFIDNIDRCDPENMIETFKAVKGFFDVPEKIVYIIPFDKTILSKAYKEDKDYAQRYIEKIFDITIDIKNYDNTDKLDFIVELLKDYHNYNEIFNSTIKDMVSRTSFNTPREIINVLNSYITEYNIMVKKNGIKFFSDENNLNYLMKYTIMKIKFPEIFYFAHENPSKLGEIEKSASNVARYEDLKSEYDFLENKELESFLKITFSILAQNYSSFYSLQDTKKYKLEYEIEQLIYKKDYEELNKLIEEDSKKFVEYLKRKIIYNVKNDMWEISIVSDLMFFINLLRNNLLSDEEKQEVIDSWKIVWNNLDFKNKIIYKNLILFDDIIIIAKEIKDDKFNEILLKGIIENQFKFDEDKITENFFKLFKYINILKLKPEEIQFINQQVTKIIDNNLYKENLYGTSFSGNLSAYISEENYINLMNKMNIDDVGIFDNLLKGIKKKFESIYNESVFNKLIECFNKIGNGIKDFNSINSFFIFIYDNKEKDNWNSIVNSLNIKLEFEEIKNNDFYTNLLNIYSLLNNPNETIKDILLNVNQKENKKTIFDYMSNYTSEKDNPLINLFKNFIESINSDEYKEDIHTILNFYDNNKSLIKEWFINYCVNNDEDTLSTTYNNINSPESKEVFIDDCINIINSFDLELKSMILFESSEKRFKEFVNKYSEIEKLIKILSTCKKSYNCFIAFDRFIEVIGNKDNILEGEFNSIFELLKSDTINKNQSKVVINILMDNKINSQNLLKIYNEINITNNGLLKNIKGKLEEQGLINEYKKLDSSEEKKEEEEIKN